MENIKSVIDTLITPRIPILAEKIVNLQYQRQPELWEPYGEAGRQISIRDAGYHIPFLTEAILADDVHIFTDYVSWVKSLFHGLKFPDSVMVTTLECTYEVLMAQLPEEHKEIFEHYIQAGIVQMRQPIILTDSFIDISTDLGKVAEKYIGFLLKGDRRSASSLIMNEVKSGVPVRDIYIEVFQKSQYEIGRLWLNNKISVAKEHFCSAATQMIMSQLYPYIFATDRIGKRFLAACIGGELHEIGIRMVADFFEIEGWDTHYLGANTPTGSILKSIDEYDIPIIGLSVAMPFHLSLLEKSIQQIRSSSSGKNVKIIVGGNALNARPSLWEKFGADGFAPDALSAVKLAYRLIA